LKKAIIIFVTLFLTIIVSQDLFCQKISHSQGLVIHFAFPEGRITDSNKLVLHIEYKNATKDSLFIYDSLIDGNKHDFYGNLYTEFEKLKNGKYIDVVDVSYDEFIGDSTPQPILKYAVLKPYDSVRVKYNLMGRAGFVAKGTYRIRFNLLLIPKKSSKQYGRRYRTSRWFYFEVTRRFQRPIPLSS
jgi:hypothetical protein